MLVIVLEVSRGNVLFTEFPKRPGQPTCPSTLVRGAVFTLVVLKEPLSTYVPAAVCLGLLLLLDSCHFLARTKGAVRCPSKKIPPAHGN